MACRSVGRLVHEDAVHGSCALQPGCGVHDVAGRHALALGRAGIERDECLAGGDSDAELELVFERELPDRERGADGTLRVIFVRRRSAEQRHGRVPDELLDRAAVALELLADALVVRAEERCDVLRIHRLRTRREADEVAEHDRDDLSFSA